MTMIDVKECAIDRSRVVVHIRPFLKLLLKTLYAWLLFYASQQLKKEACLLILAGGSTILSYSTGTDSTASRRGHEDEASTSGS